MKISLRILLASCLLILLNSGCSKSDNNPTPNGSTAGVHHIDAKMIGSWMWTKASDGAYYDNNGVYNGAASGFATQYIINANGYGKCYNHIYSSISGATGFEVNISSTGFFETDNQGHLGYFPLQGTYKTSNGINRLLAGNELYNEQTKAGKIFLYQELVVTTQGGRPCFQVTSSDHITDTYFRIK